MLEKRVFELEKGRPGQSSLRALVLGSWIACLGRAEVDNQANAWLSLEHALVLIGMGGQVLYLCY